VVRVSASRSWEKTMMHRLLEPPFDLIVDYLLLAFGCAFIGSATDSQIGIGCWCICVAMRKP